MGTAQEREVEALAHGDVATIIPIVTALASSYTRGHGFDGDTPNRDVAAVIATASARLAANPKQVDSTVGPFSTRGGFTGWTLAEQFVLNRYRKRAM